MQGRPYLGQELEAEVGGPQRGSPDLVLPLVLQEVYTRSPWGVVCEFCFADVPGGPMVPHYCRAEYPAQGTIDAKMRMVEQMVQARTPEELYAKSPSVPPLGGGVFLQEPPNDKGTWNNVKKQYQGVKDLPELKWNQIYNLVGQSSQGDHGRLRGLRNEGRPSPRVGADTEKPPAILALIWKQSAQCPYVCTCILGIGAGAVVSAVRAAWMQGGVECPGVCLSLSCGLHHFAYVSPSFKASHWK